MLFLSIFVTYSTEKLRKIFLITALLFAELSYAQSHRYPVFADDEVWPEKGTWITIIIVAVFSFFIIALIVSIIRKSKESGRKTIVDGFNIKKFGKGNMMHSLFPRSSSKYSKRRDKRGGVSSGTGTGIGTGGFGGTW